MAYFFKSRIGRRLDCVWSTAVACKLCRWLLGRLGIFGRHDWKNELDSPTLRLEQPAAVVQSLSPSSLDSHGTIICAAL